MKTGMGMFGYPKMKYWIGQLMITKFKIMDNSCVDISFEERRYLVKERSEKDIEKYGSAQKAIEVLISELEEMESLWSMYSSDCLGHGITCTRLKIQYIQRNYVYEQT
jgi:hypothetical protein